MLFDGFSTVGRYLMKSILVYGDSLVWGRNASQKDRHSFDDRWPNVLASKLKDVTVWEAGLGGRTTDLEFQAELGGMA